MFSEGWNKIPRLLHNLGYKNLVALDQPTTNAKKPQQIIHHCTKIPDIASKADLILKEDHTPSSSHDLHTWTAPLEQLGKKFPILLHTDRTTFLLECYDYDDQQESWWHLNMRSTQK